MDIELEKYHILSSGKPEKTPNTGDKVNLSLRKVSRKELSRTVQEWEDAVALEGDEEPSVEDTKVEVLTAMTEGIYVRITGNASIGEKTLPCKADYEAGVSYEKGRIIGDLTTREIVD